MTLDDTSIRSLLQIPASDDERSNRCSILIPIVQSCIEEHLKKMYCYKDYLNSEGALELPDAFALPLLSIVGTALNGGTLHGKNSENVGDWSASFAKIDEAIASALKTIIRPKVKFV